MRRYLFSFLSIFILPLLFLGIFAFSDTTKAAVAPYFELSAAEGQGADSNEFYVGRCFRVNIYVNTGGINTNGADVEINYDNSAAQIVQSDCSSAADTVYTDGLYSAYPAAGNFVTDEKILLSAYNNADVSTNVAHGLYGHFFVKVSSAQDPFVMSFQYTDGVTTDTNLAETNGDGTDILSSVVDLSLKLVSDNNDPSISSQSPASGAVGVSVSSNITFIVADTMAGVKSSTVAVRMKKGTGDYVSQAVSLGAPLTTNANRYYQYAATVNPNAQMKTNGGYYEYSTQYTVEASTSDLASPGHSATSTWTFTTEGDTDAPYISNRSPSVAEVGVASTTAISFRLKDYKANGGVIPGFGLDTATISVLVTSAGTGDHTYTCDSEGVTCDTSGGNQNVLVTIDPAANFAESETVTVKVDASDLAPSPNVMNQVVYTFSTADTIPPVIANFTPVVNSFGNASTTNMSFHLTDSGAGVAIETLEIYVNDTFYTAASPELTITGDASDYLVVINPADNFVDNQAVTLRISVRDQAPTLNYVDPNPTLLSFIVGLSSDAPDDCPAAPVCEVCPELRCGGGGVVYVDKVCPSAPVCEEKIQYITVTTTVREEVYVPVSSTDSIICPVSPSSGGGSSGGTQQVVELNGLGIVSSTGNVVLEKINGKTFEQNSTFSLLYTDEYLELSGFNRISPNSIMPVLIYPVDDSNNPLIFYTKVASDASFHVKVKNIFEAGLHRVATVANLGSSGPSELALASIDVTKAPVESAPILSFGSNSKNSFVTRSISLWPIYIYLAIFAISLMSLIFVRSFMGNVAFVMTMLLVIIGFVDFEMQNNKSALYNKKLFGSASVTQKTEDLAKEKYLTLINDQKDPMGKLEIILSDPMTGKPIKNAVASFEDQSTVSNNEGKMVLNDVYSNGSLAMYFKDENVTINVPVEKSAHVEYKISPSLSKVLAKIEPDFAQRKFKKVYDFAALDLQKSQTGENFVDEKNAEVLKTLARYRIMDQKFDPRAILFPTWTSLKTTKTYSKVMRVDFVYDLYNDKEGLVTTREPWYFVQENGSWKFVE